MMKLAQPNLITIGLPLLFFLEIFIQPIQAQEKTEEEGAWFTTTEVSKNVYCINDHTADNIYLVVGKDSALLIDTGLGCADLRAEVERLTQLPLIVINTHGHPDHSGGNFQFEKVWVHAKDIDAAKLFSKPEKDPQMVQALLRNGGGSTAVFKPVLPAKNTDIVAFKKGKVFDLGGRTLELVEVPGHTLGSVCILDKQNKLLFGGDNNNTTVWLFFEGCAPLETYLKSLQKLDNEKFKWVFPGHGTPVQKDFISEQIYCLQGILDGSAESKIHETFAGNGMISTYKRASVFYSESNLRE